jgi:hypothetical protein
MEAGGWPPYQGEGDTVTYAFVMETATFAEMLVTSYQTILPTSQPRTVFLYPRSIQVPLFFTSGQQDRNSTIDTAE